MKQRQNNYTEVNYTEVVTNVTNCRFNQDSCDQAVLLMTEGKSQVEPGPACKDVFNDEGLKVARPETDWNPEPLEQAFKQLGLIFLLSFGPFQCYF